MPMLMEVPFLPPLPIAVKKSLSRKRSSSSSTGPIMAVSFSCENLKRHIEEEDGRRTALNSPSILILDCRTFLAHGEQHIIGAVNVHCPAILRRRLGNRLPLRTVIPIKDIRDRLLTGACSPVVLYEDGPLTSSTLVDSMAAFVARCLQQEAGINNVFILEGGFQEFRLQYPHLCVASSGATSPWAPPRSPFFAPPPPLPRSSSSPALSSLSGNAWINGAYHQEAEEPVEILPHLYLGSEYHSASKETLQRLGITALLNVSHSCPNHFEDSFRYMSIPIEDSTSEDIGIWFRRAIDFIDDVKTDGGKVLVHCQAGISRSATICMAYVMARCRLRMEQAYEFVKSRRRIISPNFSFMGQLLSFESQVFSPPCRSMSPRSPLAVLQQANTPCFSTPSSPSYKDSSATNGGSVASTPAPLSTLSSSLLLTSSPSTTTSFTPGEKTAFDFAISPSELASFVCGADAQTTTAVNSAPPTVAAAAHSHHHHLHHNRHHVGECASAAPSFFAS